MRIVTTQLSDSLEALPWVVGKCVETPKLWWAGIVHPQRSQRKKNSASDRTWISSQSGLCWLPGQPFTYQSRYASQERLGLRMAVRLQLTCRAISTRQKL